MRRTERQEAVKLRLQGKSYNQIIKILNIPSKGTLSYWFKNLNLPASARKRLSHNIALARRRGLLKYNESRTKRIKLENKMEWEVAWKSVGPLSQRELLLVGTSLYWGEGTKSERNKNAIALSLSNSDPQLIKTFMRFVREVLAVNEEKIKPSIHIHPNLDILKAKRFWAGITGLPIDRFHTFHQVSSASKFKRPKKFLPHGTARIRVNSRILFYRVKGWIEGLSPR